MQIFFQSDWGLFVFFLLAIIVLLGLMDFILKIVPINPHNTRRIVHMLVGCLVCCTPFIFESSLPVILVAVIFLIGNAVAIKFNLIKSIHETDRTSYGTVYFPVSFIILVLWFWHKDPSILITSMLIMAFADPVASWVGQGVKSPKQFRILTDIKSLQGTFAMFVTSFIVATLSMKIFYPYFTAPLSWGTALLFALFTAIYSAGAETISHQGTDNLMVPIGAAVILDVLYHGTPELQFQLMLWMGITVVIAYLAYLSKSLNHAGAMGAWLLGTVVFGLGGPEWMIPIAIFFVLSSIFTKIGKKHKKKLEQVFEKTGRRDIWQVFANGGVAMIITIIWHFMLPEYTVFWYSLFLAAVAAATADTWGTELGAFSKNDPRSIVTFKKVSPGTSGGLSFIGTAGAFTGSALIAVCGKLALAQWTDFNLSWSVVLLISIAGFIGALADSLLGATVQAQFKCPVCHKITEKTRHCGTDNIPLVHGNINMNNDMVNFLNTLIAAVFAGIFYFIAA